MTIKEIENRHGTKIYFYDENNILIATEENGKFATYRKLTEEERQTIKELI